MEMTREAAIKHLENMKWLKGYDNTTVNGVPLDSVIDDIIALLKAQEPVEPTWRLGVPFCSKCGRQFKRGYKYCPDCGRAVKWE